MVKKQEAHDNRSAFPELRELDGLKLSYGDWEADAKLAEKMFLDYSTPVLFQAKLRAMKVKQMLFDKDCSHPDVVALDKEVFTYKDWELDRDEAMRRMTGDCNILFVGEHQCKLQEMKRKEAVHRDRARFEDLQILEKLCTKLSYANWESDKEAAEQLFTGHSTELYPSKFFELKIKAMEIRQQLFEGIRTDPDIVLLDSYEFTYDGWQNDKKEAEARISGNCILSVLGEFKAFLQEMLKKQAMHMDRTSIEELRCLDSVTITCKKTINALKKSEMVDTDSVSVTSRCSEGSFFKEEDIKCVVCLEGEPTHAYIPCGHRCICERCVPMLVSSSESLKCCLCRESSVCVTRIFM
jgi:hypothetical protein